MNTFEYIFLQIAIVLVACLVGMIIVDKKYVKELKLAGIEKLVEHKTIIDGNVKTNYCEIIWLKR